MTTREKLRAVAYNLWWTWHPEAQALFRDIAPDAYRRHRNAPLAALKNAKGGVLDDPDIQDRADALYDALTEYLQGPPEIERAPSTAYFCMEYGLHESMPLYSGGLGILAGDHAKAASDVGMPFRAIGMFLKDGYFEQSFGEDGWQQAEHRPLEPKRHPMELATDDAGEPLIVEVTLGNQRLKLRAWHLLLGRTNLYLLDSDFEGNPPALRPLTRQLYQGDNKERIRQEIILGIGGLRLLRAIDCEPDVYHANEGHCAFLMLELLREYMDAGLSQEEAEAAVRRQCIFTTHTPVPAGHDRFRPELFHDQMGSFQEASGLPMKELMRYGRVDPTDSSESFTMTVLGLKLSRQANGVSELNGHVARQQWQDLYPDRALDEVPIDAITNGVHFPTWTAPPARDFWTEHLGEDWMTRRHEPEIWQQVAQIDDAALWDLRTRLRHRLIDFAERHAERQTLPQTPDLDPEALTIGFARRFATYKRAPLIFSDKERARALFANVDQPIQILYAGKAHPDDEGGKRFIQRIYEISQETGFKGKVVFLENYDMQIGRMLVSGCDVWLNNPRRPLEASGTSGQKIGIHGGLNLSVLDGWWPEGYNGANGWAIGPEPSGSYGTEDPDVQDEQDAESLYEQLEDHVIPEFYDRDADGLPRDWIARMRNSMQTVVGPFSAKRMVIDYIDEMYNVPAQAE